MRHIKKFELDYLIVGISTLVFLIAITLLIKPELLFNIKSNNSSSEQIALLTNLNNDIRVKYSNEINWLPANKKTDLYNQQMVFSGGESSAEVEFKKGEIFKLAPNSMILITQLSENETSLDLKQGSISGELTENINLKVGDKNISAEKGSRSQIKVLKNQDKSILQVKSGNIDLTSANGNINEKINQNTEVDLALKKISKKDILHTLKSPIQSEKLWKETNDEILFKWSSKKPSNDFIQFSNQVEFSNSKEFKVNKDTISIKKSELNCSFCYWKIITKDESGNAINESLFETFQIFENLAPIINSPINNSIVTLDKKQKTKVMLSWQDIKYSKGFEIQIAESRELLTNNPIIKVENNQLLYEVEHKAYFWRIRGIRENNQNTPWTDIASFKIGNFDEVRTVTLNFPKNNSSITTLTLPYELKVNWDSIGIKGKYELLISNSEKFEKDKSKSLITSKTSTTIKLKNAGKYFWKVRFIGDDQAYYPTSETYTLEINEYQKLPPIEFEIEEINFEVKSNYKFIDHFISLVFPTAYAEESKSYNIEWPKVENVNGYEIELSKESSFKKLILRKKTKKSLFSIKNLAPGTYYWRVSAIDQNNVVGKPSEAVILKIKFKNIHSLIETNILTKESNFNGLTLQEIKWSASRYCKSYDVELLRKNGDLIKKLNLNTSVWKDEFPINTKLGWKVHCLDKNNKIINSSNMFPLYFKYPRQFSPPILIAPINKNLNKYIGKEFSIPFNWNEVKDAKAYRLTIFQNEKLDNPIFDQEVATNKKVVNFNSEITGTLYWRVQTIGEDSFSKPSKTHKFNIIRREIENIEYLLPSENLVSITKNSTLIHFSWKDIGKKYLITIGTDSNLKDTLYKRIVTTPNFKVNLSPGSYYWRVKAVVKDEMTDNKYFNLSPDSKTNYFELHRVERRFYQLAIGSGYIDSEQSIDSVNSDIFKGKGQFPLLNLELTLADYPILKNWGYFANIKYKTSSPYLESTTDEKNVVENFIDYELLASYYFTHFSHFHFYGHLGLYATQFIFSASENNELALNYLDLNFANLGINLFKRFNNIITESELSYLTPLKSGQSTNGLRFNISTLYDFESFSMGLKLNYQQINLVANDLGLSNDNDYIYTTQYDFSLLLRKRF